MKNKKLSVLVTLDSMRYPNTGFFYFGKSLAQHLAQINSDLDLTLYTHSSVSRTVLPTNVRLINKRVLHKVLFPYKFDLIHFSDQYCHPRPTLVRGRKILTIHDINPFFELEKQPEKQARYIKKIRNYIAVFDRVVAISEFVASQVIEYFPEAATKISVIYNGADKLPDVDASYEPLYKPSKAFLFTIGILSPRKNFHVLPALLANNDLELVIAGIIKEDYRQKILSESVKYNCENRVKIIGTISDTDKAWYYQHSTAFVFPSLAEGFGLPVIEAMHFGTPVFLSDCTSLPEIGGNAAYYFNNFEVGHMQKVFEAGMLSHKDPAKKLELKQRAKRFTWERAAREYLELYNIVLNKTLDKTLSKARF